MPAPATWFSSTRPVAASKWLVGACLALCVSLACQAAKPPAAASTTEVQPRAASGDATEVDVQSDGEEQAEAETQGDTPATRTLRYVSTPQGLKIEVDGVSLLLSAKAEKFGTGWAVKLQLDATVTDTEEYNLLTPSRGPLAFAATVKTRTGSERVGDKREGEGSVVLAPESPFHSERTFPHEKAKALRVGDELDLEVGLWGLGADAQSRRPVRDLCRVRMVVGKQTPSPLVLPPKSAEAE